MTSCSFWNGRRVLLTGHTGFKGAWLSFWLQSLGAQVYGFALEPATQPNLFSLLQPMSGLQSYLGDIRDREALTEAVSLARPSVVIHMAAQALVRRSYQDPVGTLHSNVTGTINLLEALRTNDTVLAGLNAILVVTTDKVYLNLDERRPFSEHDPLGGRDPYSASKAAAEILTSSWAQSFFAEAGVPVVTARAGNVVGGGDWSMDRLVPDLWRAVQTGKPAILRNPAAVRPWQFILDPLSGYLVYIEALVSQIGQDLPRALNFGPLAADVLTVAEATEMVLSGLGSNHSWNQASDAQPHEAHFLTLDATLAEKTIGWRPKLSARDALQWTVEWFRSIGEGIAPEKIMLEQIQRYEALS